MHRRLLTVERPQVVDFDITLNDQQYTLQTKKFLYYRPPWIDYFLPVGCHERGGTEVTITGNFTVRSRRRILRADGGQVTEEIRCKFGDAASDVTNGTAPSDIPLYCTQPLDAPIC